MDGKSVPVGMDFELVVYSHEPDDHRAKLKGHVQRETDVGRAERLADEKICRQTGGKCSSEQVDSDTNPTIEVVGRSRYPSEVVDALQRFLLEELLGTISADGC